MAGVEEVTDSRIELAAATSRKTFLGGCCGAACKGDCKGDDSCFYFERCRELAIDEERKVVRFVIITNFD